MGMLNVRWIYSRRLNSENESYWCVFLCEWGCTYIYIYICFLGYSIEDTQLEVMDKQTKWGCNGYNNNCSDNIVYYIYTYLHVYTYLYILVIRRIYHGAHNLTGCIMGYIYIKPTQNNNVVCAAVCDGDVNEILLGMHEHVWYSD